MAKDVAQRPLDLSSSIASGTPTATTDATHVDPTAATCSPWRRECRRRELARRRGGSRAHLGVHSVTAGTGVTNSGTATDPILNATAASNTKEIAVSDVSEHTVLQSDNEVLIAEWNVDSVVLVTPATCTPRLALSSPRAWRA